MKKVGVLADFFTSVFIQEPDSEFPKNEKKQVPEFNDISINPEILCKQLNNLKISKSTGPDKLRPRILKELKSVLSQHLAIIFNNSIITSKLPDEWKCANITALFKKDDKKYSGKYTPVRLTNIVCKILESIVRENIARNMKDNKLFSNKHFGFISGR